MALEALGLEAAAATARGSLVAMVAAREGCDARKEHRQEVAVAMASALLVMASVGLGSVAAAVTA